MCKYFSQIGLARASHQVIVAHGDYEKTSVTIPVVLFELLHMPFGLRNSSQTFQRCIDGITRGADFIYVYIDDLPVASSKLSWNLSLFDANISSSF